MRLSHIPAILLVASGIASAAVTGHGSLSTQGATVVDSSGNPIQVAGMSLFWPTYGGYKYYTSGAVGTTATDWKASVVRIPMPVVPSSGSPVYNKNDTNLVHTAIKAAIASDMYAVVDWHVEGDNSLTPESKAFFESFAKTYGKVPNLVWEIWNEPIFDNAATKTRNIPSRAGSNGCDLAATDPATTGWNDIKAYATEIVPIIRKYSENLILVGTPCWSRRADIAAAHPLDPATNPAFRNIGYVVHFYACSHKDTLRDLADSASNHVPVFFTEWGTSFDYGGGGVCTAESDLWLAMAKRKGISWANWSLGDNGESSAALKGGANTAGGWKDADLSASGLYVRDRIRAVGAAFPPVSIKLDTPSLPGRFEAETADTLSADGLVVETKSVIDLGYSSPKSWAAYKAKVLGAGKYALRANVATDESGTLTFKLDGKPICSLQVAKTGGWDTWAVKEVAGFDIAKAGPATLRVEWSGVGKVNLDWMEFTSPDVSTRRAARPEGLSVHPTRGGLDIELGPRTISALLADSRGRILDRFVAGQSRRNVALRTGTALLRVETSEGIWTERIAIP